MTAEEIAAQLMTHSVDSVEGVDLIKEYCARKVKVYPDWISVKDRLPEIGSQVLVCIPYHNAVLIDIYATHETLNGSQSYFKYTGITHWMPLPELPTK